MDYDDEYENPEYRYCDNPNCPCTPEKIRAANLAALASLEPLEAAATWIDSEIDEVAAEQAAADAEPISHGSVALEALREFLSQDTEHSRAVADWLLN